jgi:hypothetical protein
MKPTIEAWICDLTILCIADEKGTIRIQMPDDSTAAKALEELLKSEDVTSEFV